MERSSITSSVHLTQWGTPPTTSPDKPHTNTRQHLPDYSSGEYESNSRISTRNCFRNAGIFGYRGRNPKTNPPSTSATLSTGMTPHGKPGIWNGTSEHWTWSLQARST
eukprot:14180522-Heterocapsa_arctica.AAC.1